MYHGLRSLVLVAIILSAFRATAPVQAAQDSDDFVRRFAAATEDDPVFGPVDGTFRTDLDSPDYDGAAYAGVFAEDVAVSVDFVVPHDAEDGGWNVFVEVRCGLEPHYRFRVYSNGEWTLSFNGYEADLGEALASGNVRGLKTEAGETNTIQLVTDQEIGYVAVNGEFVDTLDLEDVGEGAVSISARSRVPNAEADYEDFTVWADQDPDDAWMTGDDELDFHVGANVFEAALESIEDDDPDFGPERGELVVESVSRLPYAIADAEVRNFVAHVEFQVPYDSEFDRWDVGLFFPLSAPVVGLPQYRFTVESINQWYLTVGTGEAIQTGPLPFLPSSAGERFTMDLVVVESSAYLAVDGQFLSRIPLPVNEDPGQIALATSVFGETTVLDSVAPYRDFTVWDLGEDHDLPEPTPSDDKSPDDKTGDEDAGEPEAETTYVSEEFGYSFTYDDAWTLRQQLVVVGGDRVHLTSERSSVVIWGGGTNRTLSECLDVVQAQIMVIPLFSDVEVARDEDGDELREEGDDIATLTLTATETNEDGERNDVEAYTECRVIVPGESMLTVMQSVYAEYADGEREPVARLLATIEMP